MPSTTAVTSLSAKGTAGDLGATVDFTGARRIVSAVISVTPGTTDGLILIQASHDGVIWVDIATVDVIHTAPRGFNNEQGAYRYWRSNVLTRINGGTATVTFMEAG